MNYSGADIFAEQELRDWVEEEFARESDQARAIEFRALEDIVADLAQAAPTVAPKADLRARLMAQVAEETNAAKPFVSPALLSLRANEGDWIEAAPGISVKQLFVDEPSGLTTSLFRLAPGTIAAPHRHIGNEQCYILEGDFHVGDQVFGAGDFHCAATGSIHDRISTINGTLLLIVAPAEYESLS